MRKFISGVIGAFAALTIFGAAAVSANVLNDAGNAAGDAIGGAGNAVNDIAEGAENVVGDIVGNDNHENNNHVNKDGENAVLGETNQNEQVGENVKTNEETNPGTGSVEAVTFGALALGSLAVAATARKRR